MEVLIDNVRCLFGKHTIPLKPLTLVVGENSSGKSTFLGMVAAAFHQAFPAIYNVLNTSPFELGNFESVASKGCNSFSLGYSLGSPGDDEFRFMKASYTGERGQPRTSYLEIRSATAEVTVRFDGGRVSGKARLVTGEGSGESVDLESAVSPEEPSWLSSFAIQEAVMMAIHKAETKRATSPEKQPTRLLREVSNLLFFMRETFPIPLPMAPVRTRPRPTYDEVADRFKPEGDHVPLTLAKIWDEDSARSAHLHKALDEFGIESGLFEHLEVRKLRKRSGSPFQLFVTIAGPKVNLANVGYGVSQALPIVVESLLAKKTTLMLLQQPEVHLHPRAQAALGSLFPKLVASEGKQFIIETHSDYLLDRVRQEVAKGTISHEAVGILFFDKPKKYTKVHTLGLDKYGNVLGAPKSYRKFFLDEEESLLFRSGS